VGGVVKGFAILATILASLVGWLFFAASARADTTTPAAIVVVA